MLWKFYVVLHILKIPRRYFKMQEFKFKHAEKTLYLNQKRIYYSSNNNKA